MRARMLTLDRITSLPSMCNYYPLAASLTLFANILQNPTAPSAVPDIALMHCVTSILTTNFSAASNPRSSVHLVIFKQILSVAASFVAKARGEDPDKYKDLSALKLPDNYLQLQSVMGSAVDPMTCDKRWGCAESIYKRAGERIMKEEDGSASTSASHSGNEHDEDQTTPSSGGGSHDLNGFRKKSSMKFMPPVDTPSPAPPPYIPQTPGGFSAVSQTPGRTPAQSRMAGTVIRDAMNVGRQTHPDYSRHGTESPPINSGHAGVPAPTGLLNACGGGTGCYLHSGSGTRSGPQFCDGNHLNGVPVQNPHTPDMSRNQSMSDLRMQPQTPGAILGSNVPPYLSTTSPDHSQQEGMAFDFNQYNWQPETGGIPSNTGFAAEGEINFNDFTGQGLGGQNGEEGDFLPMVFQWDLADIWGGQNGGMGSGGMGF